MSLRTVHATRYVTPLREGGSLPAVVEGDDDGLYVLKFRGAGQGPKALVAELVAGEIARALGLPVPEIVLVELDAELARTEPDPEIQHLIRASAGLNLALDYLPGAVAFDPAVERPDAELASRIVWFDAYVTNVDRTARNTNLLVWHRELKLIDHGAALYFHHGWERSGTNVDQAVRADQGPRAAAAGGPASRTSTRRSRRGSRRSSRASWRSCRTRGCDYAEAFAGPGRARRLPRLSDAPARRARSFRAGGDPCPRSAPMTTR